MTRSEQMGRVRQVDTTPELQLRSELWRRGLRYRLSQRVNGVRPDLVFAGERVAVFVDGCFWHGCPEHYVAPRSRIEFWSEKRRANFERDRAQTLRLMADGWRVLRFFEHEVSLSAFRVADDIARTIRAGAPSNCAMRRVVSVDFIEAGLERRTVADLVDTTLIEASTGPRVGRGGLPSHHA